MDGLTRDDLDAVARLRSRLRERVPVTVRLGGFRPAAVLVPLCVCPDGLALLLTERTADLPSHAGQVAFPGGKLDAEDADASACALREAAKELGRASSSNGCHEIRPLAVFRPGSLPA